MKLNPYILSIVILAAIMIGMSINTISPQSLLNGKEVIRNTTAEFNTSSISEVNSSSGLTTEYFTKFFSENGFTVLPVFKGMTTDIYSGKITVSNTDIEFQIDVYYERSSKEILLIEGNIYGGSDTSSNNDQESIDLVNKVTENYFGMLAALPYNTSIPEEARDWVKNNIIEAYSEDRKDKISKQFGLAKFNTFGSPLMRTLEIDFGF